MFSLTALSTLASPFSNMHDAWADMRVSPLWHYTCTARRIMMRMVGSSWSMPHMFHQQTAAVYWNLLVVCDQG
jgi:hypothetical protein